MKGTLEFINDTLYAGAGQAAMNRWPDMKAFSYVFGCRNPVSWSQFSGLAPHCTEMIYTTGLYLAELDEEDSKLSRRMVVKWINFAHGLDPWTSRQPDGYDLTVTEDGIEKVGLYAKSDYRRVDAQDHIAQNINQFGELFRNFLELEMVRME